MKERRRLAFPTGFLLVLTLLASTIPFAASQNTPQNTLIYGGSSAQNEVSIAVNPLNRQNIVVGFNDKTSGFWVPSYAYSIDGGTTWTYGGSLPRGTLSGYPFCDPWLAFDNAGYLYYVALSDTSKHEVFVCVAAPNSNGIVGPQGFSAPQIVDSGTNDNDKPAIAVDRTGGTYDGRVYVVWSHKTTAANGNTGYKIFFRSAQRTAGTTTLTWNTAQQVGPDTFTQGPQVAIGPAGQVYVAYIRMTSMSIPTADAQLFSYSTDGGATFTKNIFVSSVTPVSWSVTPNNGWARHQSFPTLGVDNQTGTIYVAWADKRNGDDDILLSSSTDGGKTWLSTPRRINDDTIGNGKDQWSPALTVQSNIVDVAFYDRRNDANNKLTALYHAYSSDGGKTFYNYAVTSALTNPDAFSGDASSCVGDYIGITSVPTPSLFLFGVTSQSYVAWGDGRNGKINPKDFNSDVYFSTYNNTYSFLPFIRVLYYIWPPFLIWPPVYVRDISSIITILPANGYEGAVNLTVTSNIPNFSYRFSQYSGIPPFNTTLTITAPNATEGNYIANVNMYYGDGEMLSAPLEIDIKTKPYAFLATTEANPGDEVALVGDLLKPNSSADIFFDNTKLKTADTNGTGTLSTTIVIPSNTPDGNHTVSIRDSAGTQVSASLQTPVREIEGEEEKLPSTPTPTPPIIDWLAKNLWLVIAILVVIIVIAAIVVIARRRK